LLNAWIRNSYNKVANVLMQDGDQFRGPLHFGVFELDLQLGELRKHGLRIWLQEQPFQVLAMSRMHHGEVVTREELQKKRWPAGTFVNFDHGLNKAINKVRDALGDSAESPRFVEAASSRGYRLIAEDKVANAPGRVPTQLYSLCTFRFVGTVAVTPFVSDFRSTWRPL
jgi:DNA-binding winged helix-turn-helix (wHTH) protein